uniref:TPM domain-containing protein n=1 Tax=Leptospira noguchii TaxID=28182 RepID=UPI0009E4052C
MNLLKTQMIQSVTIKILFFVCLLVCTAGIHLKIGNPHSVFIIEQWRAEDPAIPPLRTQITDPNSIFTNSQKAELTNKLVSFEKRKGSQIAILIISSTQDWTIEEYAVKVFETWKLGRKEIDDGVLIVVAIQDHKTRIEVGYGLEGIIPDATAKRIVEEFMIPKFREGNYFQGISDGIDAVMTKINGEELSQTNKIPKFFEVINEYSIYIFPTFVSIIVIISILISIGIFGTIGLAGILIFIGYIWESIILGIGILILLILCFSMTVYLKKKMRRKSFWDYIIVSVYISLVIFGTIGLIGVLFFIGLISESIILGIGILILLILFF